MKRSVERAARTLTELPVGVWADTDRDCFEAARAVLVEELGHLDRSRARQSAARTRTDPRGGYKRPSQAKRQRRATPPGHWTLPQAREFVYNRSQGNCEAITPVCTGKAAQVHHKRGRGGPDPHNPTLLLHLCSACHSYAHSHVDESYDAGWLVKRLGVS